MTLTRALAARLAELSRQPLPGEVAEAAKLHLLDALGVGLAASTLKPGRPYRRYAETIAGGGPATVLGLATGASAADAALVNGGLIHSLEFDDTHTGSIIHGSSVLAATALAVGERGEVSGAALLSAFVGGWEILVRLGLASPGCYQARGFQVTSVAGAIAAAFVAATLKRLDAERTVAAAGIALSQASGVLEFLSNGSSVKSLHPGWAAHAGIVAADLAEAGMTGPGTALEGRFGLFAVFADDPDAKHRFAAGIATLGRDWHLLEAAFKLYPCCHYIHPFIEAVDQLCRDGLTADRLATLACRVPSGMAALICEPWASKLDPPSGHAARWSLPVLLAARLLGRPVDLAFFEEDVAADLRPLAGRISWEPMEAADFPHRFEAELSADLADGGRLSARIEDVYGGAKRPARREEVLAKFKDNAGRALAPATAERLRESVESLDRLPSLGPLSSDLRGSGIPGETISRHHSGQGASAVA